MAISKITDIEYGVTKFNRLLVLSDAEPRIAENGWKTKRFLCLCDCGKETVVIRTYVTRGLTKSCGCLQREKSSEAASKIKHGHSSTSKKNSSREYTAWQAMRTRCKNPAAAEFCYYGGRGIEVCERWDVFLNFLEDMGKRPENQTLDRIDTNGNYEPGNCRWATAEIQANNKRSSRFVVFNEEKMTIAQASRKSGVARHIISTRLNSGYAMEQIFNTPVGELKPWHK